MCVCVCVCVCVFDRKKKMQAIEKRESEADRKPVRACAVCVNMHACIHTLLTSRQLCMCVFVCVQTCGGAPLCNDL